VTSFPSSPEDFAKPGRPKFLGGLFFWHPVERIWADSPLSNASLNLGIALDDRKTIVRCEALMIVIPLLAALLVGVPQDPALIRSLIDVLFPAVQ